MSDKERFGINNLTNYFLEKSYNLSHILLLLDIRHKPTIEDKNMYDWLKAQAVPFYILLNKADKLSSSKIEEQKRIISKSLFCDDLLIDFSSESKLNIDKVLDILNKL